MSRPIGTAAELGRRRRRAIQAVAEGQPRPAVARVLGVHPKTLARWPGGLDARPQPGPAPGLSDSDLGRPEALLAQGAKAHGWQNQFWTAARVARLIERHFGVRYHPEHVRKVLKRRRAGPARGPAARPGSATTRRWRGGWVASSPASSARPSAAGPTSCSSTSPGSS